MPEEDKQKRPPIPIDSIRVIQDDCSDIDDDMRWLAALSSDTVMRLGEAVGLAITDIDLDSEIPYINLTPTSVEKF
jgi:integrase